MHYLHTDNSCYVSPPARVGPLSRFFPSCIFYLRFIGVVFRAAAKAKSGNYDYDEWGRDSLEVLRLLEDAGLQFEITGLAPLEGLDGPCVFVSNHMSIMETLILPAIILPYAKVTFVIKDSLLTYPVFKHVMISRNPVAVTRSNPRQDFKTVLSEGVDRLNNGISVIVFPQTTRSTGFDPRHFGSIGVKLAKKAEVPIVPVALKTDAWQNGRFLSKDVGRLRPEIPVRVAFGEPLSVAGKGGEEHQRVIDFIQDKLGQWQ